MVMFKIEADYELLNYYDTIRKKQIQAYNFKEK